jgi:membrane-bound ClpP family serine protease
MWIVAGVLLGLVVLVSLVGFHTGPHTHVAAGALGVLAALWLILMAADGRSSSVLWALLSADAVLSGGIGVMAWYGLVEGAGAERDHAPPSIVGAEGTVVSALSPEGVVRAGGEEWTAVSLNGPVPVGARVQVVRRTGVRIEVWRDDLDEVATDNHFTLDRSDVGTREEGS